MPKETFYFQHDYNARNDEKILELRSQFGVEGYGAFWMLIESMAESGTTNVSKNLLAGLSLSFGLAKTKLCEIIDFCISIDLLKEQNGFIFSKRLLKHKEFRSERSNSGKKGADIKWKSVREKKRIFKSMALFFNNTCVKCEGESGLLNVERDHIIPTYQGGIDEPTNWQPLCAKCNSAKGPETIDWRISYAKKNGLAIPSEWLSYKEPIAKNSKEKERKENYISINNNTVFNKIDELNNNLNSNNLKNTDVIFWIDEKKLFQNDFRWKEKFCRDKKIIQPDLEKWMNEFLDDLELKEDVKELKELKNHFTNWYNKFKNGNTANFINDKSTGSTSRKRMEAIKRY